MSASNPSVAEPRRQSLDIEMIREARRRISDQIVRTPCASAEWIGELFDAHAWFKLENLQRTGSFKDRGALNRILNIPPEQRDAGIVAASAGNHAQGVAFHGARLGFRVKIVMPERTPLIKVSRTQQFGAEVILHGANYDEAMDEARRIRDSEGSTLIHPFDDIHVMAGQGTIGLELLEECPQMEVLIVPVGGGGLISGVALAIKSERPDVRIVGVQAGRMASAVHARAEGTIVKLPPAETIADGIAVRRIGDSTFPIIEELVDQLVTVTEEEIASSVLLLLEREKTVAEPAAAVTLAAAVAGKVPDVAGRHVVMLLSGGNIDVNLLSRIIDRGLSNDGRLARLDVRVPDRPGALAALATAIAAKGANILQLDHKRGSDGVWLTEVDVEMTLEMRGRAHVDELVDSLKAAGYEVRRKPVNGVP